MQISLCDLRSSDEHYRQEIDDAIKRVIDNSSFILGKEVEAFENAFADWLGAKYCIGVSSCTMAIYLALRSLGIGDGTKTYKDEVIVPDFTIAADIEPVLMCGAVPVICDVGDDGCINVDELEKRIERGRTKAIIVVHLYGNACDLHTLCEIGEKYNIPIIEDCAQSTGTLYKGRMTGTFTDLACFSFFPSKVLGAYGDGGMVATDSEELAQRLYALRNHGWHKGSKYTSEMVGVNSRLSGIQAAILGVKLKYLNEAIDKRRNIAEQYDKHLKDIFEILLPMENDFVRHSYYMYSIRSQRRDELMQHLLDNGIKVAAHYPVTLSQNEIYKKYYKPLTEKPIAYQLANTVLSLPMYPALETEKIEYIARMIREFYE